MENLIKQIRAAMGMNQTEFARALGRSYPSVQNYERGAAPPPEVIAQLKRLAADAGRSDLADALTLNGSTAAPPPNLRRRAHQLVDRIFDGGDPDAIAAIMPNLELFAKWTDKVKPAKKRY